MTEERLALSELLEAGDGDFLRTVAGAVLQLLTETDVDGLIGAGHYERSGERTTWRNGHRERVLDTRLGSLQLRIPKVAARQLLPVVPRGAEGFGEGADRGDPRSVDWRRFDAAGGRVGAGDGAERDQQVAGLCRSDNRCGGEHRWQARDCRAAYRSVGSRDVLVRVSQEPGAAGPGVA